MSSCPGDQAPRLHKSVGEFYAGLTGCEGLGSTATTKSCALLNRCPAAVQEALSLIHPDVIKNYYGCGLPFPSAVEGCRVLDLGSGMGRDSFLLGRLAGPRGRVIGIDMTDAMLERARAMIPYHAEKFGFENVEFRKGYLESLDRVPDLELESFDIIISNCVICLTSDKLSVFRHAFDLLKPGGELCFSDVYADSNEICPEIRDNELAWNEGFGGALAWSSFQKMTAQIGFSSPFILSSLDYEAVNDQLKELIEDRKYWARTCRLFKMGGAPASGLKKVEYLGTIPDSPQELHFCQNYNFRKKEIYEVRAETSQCLKASRFNAHFKFL